MIDTSTPILVLRSTHHGGLGVTRSLGRLGIPVYVMDANIRTPAFSSRYCRKRFVWDIEQAPAEDSVEYLAGIGRRLGRPILIPTTDTASLFIASNANALRQWLIFPSQFFHLVRSLYSNREMHQLAATAGVPTPNTFFPESMQDALKFAERARFPIILKPIEQWRAKNKAAGDKVIVHRKRELIDTYEIMEDPQRPNVMFQEYIPGGEEVNWMFNGYFNENSECLFGLTGKKIRQNRPYAGVTSLGVCLHNAIVAATTRRFMKTLGYYGILDIGYRYDARDRLYKVIYVNPRLGCTFRLFISDNGMDVARAAYLDLTGQPIDAGHALPGRKWMVEDLDVVSAIRYWRDGNLTAGEWLRSFRGLQESAFFAPDDPLPAISMCWNDFSAFFRRFRAGDGTTSSQAQNFPSPLAGSTAKS